MTINEAISKVDALKVNTYGRKEKIDWLSTLDGIIKKEIIDFHEGVNKDEEIVKYINSVRAKYEKDLNEYMKVNEVSLEEAKANVPFVEVSYKDAKEYIEANRNDITFNGYNADTPADTQLLVPAPYDDIYLRWLDFGNAFFQRINDLFRISTAKI